MKIDELAKKPTFEQAEGAFGKLLRQAGVANRARETKAAESFPSSVRTALTTHPELQKKDKLNILMIYGSVHTSLQQRVRNLRLGIQTRRSLHPSPMRYSYTNRCLRSILWGVEVKGKDIKKAFFERLISVTYWSRYTPEEVMRAVSVDALEVYFNKMVDTLPSHLAPVLYKKLIMRGQTEDAQQTLFTWLAKYKIPSDPASEEFKNFVAS